MRHFFTVISFIVVFTLTIQSQSTPPKREFRAAWVASVANLDWPTNPGEPVAKQKEDLLEIFDYLDGLNINVVIFQIRPECDALYDSPYEPWSYWLTGGQGSPPAPFYDPLTFAVEEAHKRGMELHAWFNPYRAVKTIGQYGVSSQHVSVQHPDWILTFNSLKILDPGLPMVREYNRDVIMDVVNRYDIDGIHFDDYFYPYPPDQITNQDITTFQTYPNGFTNIKDWRRNNVNMFIQMIMDSINAVKPHVKFGISPFGIWKNGVPPGITGMNAYDVIFADPMAWLRDGSVDYLTPQLYWKIGGSQDYSKLMPWWADSVDFYDRHFYPGHIFGSSYTVLELPNQVKLNRANPKVQGSVFFRAKLFLNNSLNFSDSLRNNYYRYKSILPVMNWKDTVKPNPPQNLVYERIPGTAYAGFQWDLPAVASDGDTASRYVLYRFENSNIQPSDLEDPSKILEIEGNRLSIPQTPSSWTGDAYFLVTSLDRNYNESDMSQIVTVPPPQQPLLAFPADGAQNVADTFTVGWYYPYQSSSYRLQISTDQNFNTVDTDIIGLTDTTAQVTGLSGQSTYYWRIAADNAAGTSQFSASRSFTTGFPIAPALVYPNNNTGGYPLEVNFIWNSSAASETYRLQLAKSRNFTPTSITLDESGLPDTTYTSPTLELNRFYFWRVGGENLLGFSGWSDTFAFKTTSTSLVAENNRIPNEYELAQNYPNPFNPATVIEFNIPKGGITSLRVYNLLGEEVAELVNEELNPGFYSVDFDGSKLSSGIYIYILRSNDRQFSRKMMLVK